MSLSGAATRQPAGRSSPPPSHDLLFRACGGWGAAARSLPRRSSSGISPMRALEMRLSLQQPSPAFVALRSRSRDGNCRLRERTRLLDLDDEVLDPFPGIGDLLQAPAGDFIRLLRTP